jgi:hypothetical protein
VRTDKQLYAAVVAVFALTRLLLHAAGVSFGVSYDWQHFHDLDLLEHRLWESLLYTHSFSPSMNLLVGLLLKTGTSHPLLVYQSVFAALGLCFAMCLGYVLRALSFGRVTSLAIVSLFICTPAFIYLENLFHYEFPTAAVLMLSWFALHRALVTRRAGYWCGFFALCALLAYLRLTFHLAWVVTMLALALCFDARKWRMLLAAAVLPLMLVVALYAKNQLLFGFFGSSSRTGFTMALVTTQQLSKQERRDWVRQGRLHPASLRSVYSGAQAYAQFVDLGAATGIPVLDRLTRKSGAVNYNHWALIEVSALLAKDARYVLSQRPTLYLKTLRRGVTDYFAPTTRWHPKDPAGSPHQANRAVVGAWENAWNAFMHSAPPRPYGLYVLLLALDGYALVVAALRLLRRRFRDSVQEKLILAMLLNVIYVPALSCMVAIGELERYRFLVEAPMWIAALWALRLLASLMSAAKPRSDTRSSPAQSPSAEHCRP